MEIEVLLPDVAIKIVPPVGGSDIIVQSTEQGPPGAAGGANSNTILYGAINPPNGLGADGNFYVNTTTHFLFGPKQAGAWPAGTSLVGPPGNDGAPGRDGAPGQDGAPGAPGADGRTVLNGTGAPANGTGTNGDFYLDTAGPTLYGPKTAGTWGAGTTLVGPQGAPGNNGAPGADGAPGSNGVDGRTLLNGTVDPGAGVGANGDFYLRTDTKQLFGPKTAGAWGAGVSLVGPQGNPGNDGAPGAAGAPGSNGLDGRTVLNGAGAPAGGTGANGDFYIDTTAWDLYGPKTAGAWGAATSLIGPQKVTSASVPAGEADTMKFFRLAKAKKSHVATLGPNGDKAAVGLQQALKLQRSWRAHSNVTTAAVFGFGNSTTGTPTARTMVTTSNFYGQTPKIGYLTAASTNAAAGTRHGAVEFWTGNAAGLGGFLYGARIAGAELFDSSLARAFVGLLGSTAVITGGTDPSSLTNFVALARDAGETTWRIMHNDAAGTATKIDLGADFPCNTISTDVYDVWFYCLPNGTQIEYQVDRISGTTGLVTHTASGTISMDLFSNTTRVAPQIWLSTGNPGVATGLDVFWQYAETEY